MPMMPCGLGRGAASMACCLALGILGACSQAQEPESFSAIEVDAIHQAQAGPVSKCVNFGNALDAPEEGAWSYVIKDEHLRAAALGGFDTVRIPIRWSAHAEYAPPYTIEPEFLARVDHVVSLAMSLGLQVIVDVHHYEEIMSHPDRHTERLFGIWEQLAKHYADAPDGLIFEVLNEPVDKLDNARMRKINAEVLRIIRQESPTRWVIVSGDRWGSFEGLVNAADGLPDDNRTIWSFHFYRPYEFTHQGAPWAAEEMPTGVRWGTARDRQEILDLADEAAEFAAHYKKPLFMGEFGAFPAAPFDDRVAWTRFVRQVSEAHGFGWCHWDFAASFPIYDAGENSYIPEMLSALMDEE